ncbi:protein CDV3 homolog isoform X1 [Pimephales promelas]|uniref:protein CDV3 homolog isoform X1 n=1 Tax=Pimephales promelas TaxID=90988 RepID=UPI001955D757|nr:protein CDV3 homolog isoform X1 [Pimephales promelas]XP_039522595.1 protein CDV3 homolog isoform X1 [Pimephales promelas]KAG1953827.1 protein CDV3 [Pimephales promelas]KAG1953828.1 protein CDV3 [Pimephales promelas]
MADVAPAGVEKSLDDFFAKRDKKKKKEKVKGKEQATGGAVMVLKKTKREKEKSTKSENQDAQMEKEDEEWKEFEQKEVDYTGLRLQALQMSDEKEEEEYEKEEVGEDGEIILVSGDKVSGPWNKSGAPPSAAPVEEVEVPEPKAPGVYRPPGARLTTTKRGPTQGPPEIFNDAQFPSLLSTARHVETRKDREMEKTFEVVKHKSRVREGEGQGSMQQLQLDNQYAILGDK